MKLRRLGQLVQILPEAPPGLAIQLGADLGQRQSCRRNLVDHYGLRVPPVPLSQPSSALFQSQSCFITGRLHRWHVSQLDSSSGVADVVLRRQILAQVHLAGELLITRRHRDRSGSGLPTVSPSPAFGCGCTSAPDCGLPAPRMRRLQLHHRDFRSLAARIGRRAAHVLRRRLRPSP